MAVTAKSRAMIVDDISLRLQQGKPSGDFEVPRAQIEHILDQVRDEFVATLVVEAAKIDGNFRDPTYIVTETFSTALDTTPLTVLMTQNILSVPKNDYGLVRVMVTSTSGGTVRVHKVDLFELHNMEAMEFTAPSETRPVVYRKEQTLYFKGLAQVFGNYTSIEIDYIESMVGSDTNFSISGVHVSAVTKMAEDVLRKQMGLIIYDTINDGDQNSQVNTQQTRQRR